MSFCQFNLYAAMQVVLPTKFATCVFQFRFFFRPPLSVCLVLYCT